MKGFKKRWNQELDTLVPGMSDQVRQADIQTVPQTTQLNSTVQPKGFKSWFKHHKGRFFVSIASAMAAVLLAVFVLPALVNIATVSNSPTAVVVEINPSVAFSVDKNGVVTKVVANNADADIVLYGGADKQMIGKTIEQATNIFVDLAKQMGYLSENNNDIAIYTDEEHSKLLNNIEKSVTNYLKDCSFTCVVNSSSIALSDLCDKLHLQVTTSLEQLEQTMHDLQTKFYVRAASGEQFDFGQAYSEQVSSQNVLDMVKSTLEQQWNLAQQRYEDICQIQLLVTQWLLSFFGEEEKVALEQAIVAYEQKYKVHLSLETISDEIAEQMDNVSAMVETLFSTLALITVEYIAEHTQELADILHQLEVGYTDIMLSLLEVPQTIEDYLSKMEDYCATNYQIKMGVLPQN